ncbi:transposase [Salmonella enterica subsp. salamae]|nr:transposase [Salmonella enterica subsp. salamae]
MMHSATHKGRNAGRNTAFPAKAGRDMLPQQPSGHGCGEERHGQPVMWKMPRQYPEGGEASGPVYPLTSMAGLDAGVANPVTLTDGTVFEPVNSFQKNQKKLATLQRQLSRQVKFSNNKQKQKHKIQRLHSRIANIRRDYLHKVTTTVSKNHAMASLRI